MLPPTAVTRDVRDAGTGSVAKAVPAQSIAAPVKAARKRETKANSIEDVSEPVDAAAWKSAMSAAFGVSFSDVQLRTDAQADSIAVRSGALAYTDGREVGFARAAYEPATPAGRLRIAHEFAHIAQLRGGNARGILPAVPNLQHAEWQAQQAASALVEGRPPRVSAYSAAGHLFDKGAAAQKMTVATTNDEEALKALLQMLDTQTGDSQRSETISFIAAIAMKPGPAQQKATDRLIQLLSGSPRKNFADHMAAAGALQDWAAQNVRAYDLLLYGRLWFADHSQGDLGSGMVVSAFQKWLHVQHGKFAIDFLRKRVTGHNLVANVAARIVVDLLDLENTPEAQRFKDSYRALRAMARENGLESFGALGAASATARIFSALQGIRKQADELAWTIEIGPYGDPWQSQDIEALRKVVGDLGVQGLIQHDVPGTTPPLKVLVFSAENREETEHALMSNDPNKSGVWLRAMADMYTEVLKTSVTVQERIQVLHENARALEKLLGVTAALASDERNALFDLRHEYIVTWLSAFGSGAFDAGSAGRVLQYHNDFVVVDAKFDHFDEVVAARMFQSAHDRFQKYFESWRQADRTYLTQVDARIDEKFLDYMRYILKHEAENLQHDFRTTFSVGGDTRDVQPHELKVVARIDMDTKLFGMQSAVLYLYAENLMLTQGIVRSSVGNANFRAQLVTSLAADRGEMQGFWATGQFDKFLDKSDTYVQHLKDVIEKLKKQAEKEFLLSLAIMVIAALVTEGASLAVEAAGFSEVLAIARTARGISQASTLFEAGVFTATELSLQKAVFGKDIELSDVVKDAATNLAFMGAMKLVGKLAEPLSQGSAVRKLLVGHLVGFAGVAAISATLTRIQTGAWPADITSFLEQTAATYLLIAGLHMSFRELVAKPVLQKQLTATYARLERLSVENEALATRLHDRVNEGTLNPAEFDQLKAERERLIEAARDIGKILEHNNVISAADLADINKMADNAVADARGAVFPAGAKRGGRPMALGLPAPESVIDLTQVGDSNIWVYDPNKSQAPIEKFVSRYTDRGYTVEGNSSLRRLVDPSGRVQLLLSAGPMATPRLLLPEKSSAPDQKSTDPLAAVTGLAEPQLSVVRKQLAKINREAITKIPAEYSEYSALRTLSFLVEQRGSLQGDWGIDSVRGLADAMALPRGIPESAVRRLFMAVDAKQLPGLFKAFHEVVTSPKVNPGSQYLIADDLLPKQSVQLIKAYRALMSEGIDLPPDMDMRAVRGLESQMEQKPGRWQEWLAGIKKENRATVLRFLSDPSDPMTRLPENVTELLAEVSVDITGHPGLNPLAGDTGEAFVQSLEARPGAGKFSEKAVRTKFVDLVGSLRSRVASIQQGQPVKETGNLIGLANEVQRVSKLLLSGKEIVGLDVRAEGKQPPLISPSLFKLPSGANVKNVPGGSKVTDEPANQVNIDVLYNESGALVAEETTTRRLELREPFKALDPKNPNYGKDIDFNDFDTDRNPSDRKLLQAIKIYQLNKMGTALQVSWGGHARPAVMKISAGGFTVDLARALEALGFELSLVDGTKVTAAQIEAASIAKPQKAQSAVK